VLITKPMRCCDACEGAQRCSAAGRRPWLQCRTHTQRWRLQVVSSWFLLVHARSTQTDPLAPRVTTPRRPSWCSTTSTWSCPRMAPLSDVVSTRVLVATDDRCDLGDGVDGRRGPVRPTRRAQHLGRGHGSRPCRPARGSRGDRSTPTRRISRDLGHASLLPSRRRGGLRRI
jgi:hypothetical protein